MPILLPEKHVSEFEMVEKVKVCARPKGGDGGDRVGDELEGDLVRVGRREAGLGAEPAAEHLSADGQQAGDEAVRLEEGADPGAGATEGRRPLDHTPLLKLQASGNLSATNIMARIQRALEMSDVQLPLIEIH